MTSIIVVQVRVTKNVEDDLQTQVVHIELYPQVVFYFIKIF